MPARCRTSLYGKTFIPLSVSLWNDLGDLVFNDTGLTAFKSRVNAFYWAEFLTPVLSFLFVFSISWYWDSGVNSV